MANDIIVLGSVNIDLVVRSRKLPRPGETVLGGHFYRSAGGKGANQAVSAARAGVNRVTFLAAVGDDPYGRESVEAFELDGIRCDCIKTVVGQPTGVALIMVNEEGENCISVAPGANQCFVPDDIDRVADSVFSEASVFLSCLEIPLDTVVRGLERAKSANAKTILNPAPANESLSTQDIFRLVDIITPNAIEAEAMTGIAVVDRTSAEAAGRKLQVLGCPAAVITLGGQGCVVIQSSTTFIPAKEVQAVDSTAAGDAFNGALASALPNAVTLVDAAKWASVAAAISVTRRGAQSSLPNRNEIEFDA